MEADRASEDAASKEPPSLTLLCLLRSNDLGAVFIMELLLRLVLIKQVHERGYACCTEFQFPFIHLFPDISG